MIEGCYAFIIALASNEIQLEGQSLGMLIILRASFCFFEFVTSKSLPNPPAPISLIISQPLTKLESELSYDLLLVLVVTGEFYLYDAPTEKHLFYFPDLSGTEFDSYFSGFMSQGSIFIDFLQQRLMSFPISLIIKKENLGNTYQS